MIICNLVFDSLHVILWQHMRPKWNGWYFRKDTFKCIFFKENLNILNKIPLHWTHDKLSLVQKFAWCQAGDKPLSESMVTMQVMWYIYLSQCLNELEVFGYLSVWMLSIYQCGCCWYYKEFGFEFMYWAILCFQPKYAHGLGSLQFANGMSPVVHRMYIYSGNSLEDTR